MMTFVIRGIFLLIGAFSTAIVSAETLNLVTGSVNVTTDDIVVDAQRMPKDVQNEYLKKPDQIAIVANNLYIRRVLAQKPEAQALASKPEVRAALDLARDRILSDALLAYLQENVTPPSDQDQQRYAQALYNASDKQRFTMDEAVHVRHILLAKGADDKAKADNKVKAEKILQDIKQGADFGALAKTLSIDTNSAKNSGDLGSLGRGRTVAEFETAAFALSKEHPLSDVVESQFGFHIIQLIDYTPKRVKSFDEVLPELKEEILKKAIENKKAVEISNAGDAQKMLMENIKRFADSQK